MVDSFIKCGKTELRLSELGEVGEVVIVSIWVDVGASRKFAEIIVLLLVEGCDKHSGMGCGAT